MEVMEDNPPSSVLDGMVVGIRFGMATRQEICTASISDSSISHASQLSNPFLGLPLEYGRCESCGTSEVGKCEGHFGYIELPVPIYHPSHVSELKRMLSLVCLSCLKMKKTKFPATSGGVAQTLLSSCCKDVSAAQVSIREVKTTDGACYLALKAPKSKMHDDFWSFLEKYGYRYDGDHNTRALLPCEVMEIIKRIPLETKKKLTGKGYFPQDGYVLKYLPVPPNCLSVPIVSDGVSVMSSDPSITILRKLLRKVEIIRSSRSGEPNFESHHVEANDLQSVVDQYFQIRGTSKAARDIETHFGVNKEINESSTKAWLEKMRTLFIRKGSGFSSRSVITGDGYKRINEVGIPVEVAQRMTFEERVNIHNMSYLQKLVDENLCLTYKEGMSTYSLREGSKGHVYLKPGQIVHRRIMDGDIVFINRPPTTHKHSLQALVVYIHDDHTVKINPLICGPLGADFDGDCVHLFYPQSFAAKAEVVELFSVENQLLSSHSGNLNLQLSSDSLLSLKMLAKKSFLDRAAANQLGMFLSLPLPRPALLKASYGDSYWTSMQMLQCALPSSFDCTGGRYLIRQSEILEFGFNKEVLPAIINEIAASIFFGKGPKEALNFFDVIQPFLMESLFADGFSFGLEDLSISRSTRSNINRKIEKVRTLLFQLRTVYNELVAQQLEKQIQDVEPPIVNFALKSSKLGDLIDPKSKSAIDKVVQHIGFLGQQLFQRGRLYSKGLVEDVALHFHEKCSYDGDGYPTAEYGLLRGCFFHGLDPYEELVHSIATREIIVRSSRGLSEPGTLFKNLMAILRDVVICYDGTVRNVCSNSIIQFEYGIQAGDKTQHLFPAGEPVGVLAATSMSNPAYKAVLDASPSSTSSWELMKEILLCKVNFRNEAIDRRVILYLNDCGCGRSYCQERAVYLVKNHLRKVSLKDAALKFTIEYQRQRTRKDSSETDAGLVGHIYLNEKMIFEELKINMAAVYNRCQEKLNSFSRKKKVNQFFKRTELCFSESGNSPHSSTSCVSFIWKDDAVNDLDTTVNILADLIYPVLLETVIQGDPRISSASIIWVNPDTNTWVRNPYKSSNGELALDVILEKTAVKQSGDAWRIVLDCCLPVIHLIDTTRSIPYAIKQFQELLGISCTFDQVMQRLAASVRMVAKGVLREHLTLLASSMTCGGNLVGFNTGGYKALARQLNIQVPFTDATLFTPKRCFERAAEKCHTDSLSSIVASCSWGKHVAVGTGSRFDVLWDANEVRSKEIEGMDVYNFLHMVKGLANVEEENNACLGEDIDDLLDEENMDWSMSPQHSSGVDAVFEENLELNGPTSNGWDATTDLTEDTSKAGAWDAPTKDHAATNSKEWSGWGSSEKKDGASERVQGNPWSSPIQDSTKSGAWDAQTKDHATTSSSVWSTWGGKESEKQGGAPEKALEDSGSTGRWKDDGIKEGSKSSAWDGMNQTKKSNDWSTWDASKDQTGRKNNEWSALGNKEVQDVERAREDSWNSCRDASRDLSGPKSNDWSSWGKSKDEGTERAQESTVWNAAESGKPKSPEKQAWNLQKESNLAASSRGWDTSKDRTEPKTHEWSSWGNKDEKQDIERAKEDSWNSCDATLKGSTSGAWDTSKDLTEPKSNDWSAWGKQKDEGPERAQQPTVSNTAEWGKPKSPGNQAWNSQNESNQAASSRGWDSQIALANSESDQTFQWGKQGRESFKKSRFDGSQGWGSNAGDRKNNNRPPRAPGQRFAMFSTEEQDVLKVIDPIMLSIRRIMQQQGYNDGDPLAEEDQLFVLENVFEHHPEKETKMGAGVDYVMVSRHTSFQESRCLYVVLKDGQKEDFSYRKCMENFVRKNYPDIAESFNSKYFRKPRGRGDQTATPAGDTAATQAGDTAATPAGDQAATPAGDQAATPAGNQITTLLATDTNEWK